jgi:hypothetical protein
MALPFGYILHAATGIVVTKMSSQGRKDSKDARKNIMQRRKGSKGAKKI